MIFFLLKIYMKFCKKIFQFIRWDFRKNLLKLLSWLRFCERYTYWNKVYWGWYSTFIFYLYINTPSNEEISNKPTQKSIKKIYWTGYDYLIVILSKLELERLSFSHRCTIPYLSWESWIVYCFETVHLWLSVHLFMTIYHTLTQPNLCKIYYTYLFVEQKLIVTYNDAHLRPTTSLILQITP